MKLEPVLQPGQSYETVNSDVSGVVFRPTPLLWFLLFGFAANALLLFLGSIAFLFAAGVGIWGINIPVAWGFAIVNFVWWVGIGHAGTFISAILLLLRQHWRTSINRLAETMTIFAISCAGLFPVLHLGRPQYFYFMIPYPSTMNVWPNFRSPLLWDAAAIGTYLLVSIIFWYVGMLPDLATMRDRAQNRWARIGYGVLALGWRGASAHWERHQTASWLLAGIATPLVVSVHTVVGFDFAVSLVPGWHSTILPPYFVASAILSGFAMVLTLAIPLRKYFRLEAFITPRHLDNIGKLMLLLSWLVIYGYAMEYFTAYYSGDTYERQTQLNHAFGAYAPAFWTMVFLIVLSSQLLWFRRVRTHPGLMFILGLALNFGVWLDHFTVIIPSLSHDFLPSSWNLYAPTVWDWTTLFGSMGFFAAAYLLFVRIFPMMSMSELRRLVKESRDRKAAGGNEVANG